MKRELKNLYNQLRTYKDKSRGLFGSGMSWTILYFFLLRHKDVKSDLNLLHINYDLEKYLHDSEVEYYPFDDFVKPFYQSLKKTNPGIFDGIDLNAIFGLETDITTLSPEEVISINSIAKECGIYNYSLDSFSIEDFDEFFCDLIELVGDRDKSRLHDRTLNPELAKFIISTIPSDGACLTIGDESAQIPFYSRKKKNKIIFSGFGETQLWYYLRSILSGKDNLKINRNEWLSLINNEYDFSFINPPIGKIGNDFKNHLKDKYDFNFKYRNWESFYINLGLDALSDKGKLILLLPENFLYQQLKEFKNIRKKLVESKHLRSIIRLPRGLFKPITSIRYTIFEIDKSSTFEKIQFIDGAEIKSIVSPKNKDDLKSLFTELDYYWNGAMGFYPYVAKPLIKEIKKHGYSLAFSNFLNVSKRPENYIRQREEDLVSLSDTLNYLGLKTERNLHDVPFISISKMSESITDYKVTAEELTRVKKAKALKKLSHSAILLGKIKGSIKPTYFEHLGEDIYLKQNIAAFEIPEGYDPQYLVHELRSEFVQNQFSKIETSSTIPSFSNQMFSNIYLRIPPLERQKEIVAENLQEIAQSKIKEVEGLSDDLKYIEKEVFSSFAHDFGKILLNVSSNIEVITNYLKELDYRGIISFKDSALFEEKAEKEESIGEVLKRLNSNFSAAQDFLESEVGFYTGEKDLEVKQVNLLEVIYKWIKRQSQNGYSILIGDSFTPLGENKFEDFIAQYFAKVNTNDLYSVLDNLLTNAKEHGFKAKDNDYQFVIFLQQGTSPVGNLQISKMHIGNNGKPFPEDFSCEDLFKIHHKGPDSTGKGKGGYSVKRRLNKMGATIKCNSDILPKDKYPVQFEVSFKPVEL
ncbi:MAG: N-6 DNA methylase [Gracilimonas sp.]|uniref:N-6 DNA methylase n=1 Tax=Gracilimonas sp. TaxID=1974203 RepID=UPI0037524789|nr:N-6 DNA methylase [Gracilimonas sp.]